MTDEKKHKQRMANLVPNSERTPEQRRENARKAGIASGKARRERKTLVEALKQVLYEPIQEGSELTRLDAISIKAIKRLFDDPRMTDIKILAEMLGEFKTQIELSDPFKVVVKSEEERKEIEDLKDLSI